MKTLDQQEVKQVSGAFSCQRTISGSYGTRSGGAAQVKITCHW